MIIIFFSILLFITYASLILYYRYNWLCIPTFQNDEAITVNSTTIISVIIPARNEGKNIRDCINSIINQTYPQNLFEIIVVDDFSTDNTTEIIKAYTHPNISLLSLADHTLDGKLNSYKKKAIEIAVEKAKGSLIVTTDADCIVPKTWLQTISSFYEKYNPAFIAAPVVYIPASKKEDLLSKALNIFQSLDFITLQGITGASVYKKFHCMCNGANLAYEKKAFIAVNGFIGIDNIASGDDMLLMQKIFLLDPSRVLFLKSRDAIVQTKPPYSVSAFFNQRIRWASKADKYIDKRITAVLLLVYLFNVWLIALSVFCFFHHSMVLLLLILLAAKTIVELVFLLPVARFFNKKKMLWWFPLAQPFHIIYTIIAGWLGKFGSYRWKDRNVN